MSDPTNHQQGLVVALLSMAERGGVSIGGLFLLAFGVYGGQYAVLFPERLRESAGWFCLVVAACGLAAIVLHLLRSFLNGTQINEGAQSRFD